MAKKTGNPHVWLPYWWWQACRKCGSIKHTEPGEETECPEPDANKDLSCGWSVPPPSEKVEMVCGPDFAS